MKLNEEIQQLLRSFNLPAIRDPPQHKPPIPSNPFVAKPTDQMAGFRLAWSKREAYTDPNSLWEQEWHLAVEEDEMPGSTKVLLVMAHDSQSPLLEQLQACGFEVLAACDCREATQLLQRLVQIV